MEGRHERRRVQMAVSRTNHRLNRLFNLQRPHHQLGFYRDQLRNGLKQSGRTRAIVLSQTPRQRIRFRTRNAGCEGFRTRLKPELRLFAQQLIYLQAKHCENGGGHKRKGRPADDVVGARVF
jgi:hypothetical protein